MRPVITAFAALLAALLFALAPARALDEGDRAAMRGAVERQLDAFKRDDAAGAYAQAAPGIQRLFPTDERFMAMVRESYKPVYRPRAHAFGEFTDLGNGGATQAVRLQDAEGATWTALYSFEKQPDGSWKISGCTLVKAPEESA